jgi:hypothetical protein
MESPYHQTIQPCTLVIHRSLRTVQLIPHKQGILGVTQFNLTVRGVYAFNYSVASSSVLNRRLVYVPDTHVADGLKVSHSGYIFTAAGSTIDVVRPSDGVLLGKISTGTEVMNNLVAVPGGEWWLTGQGGIWRVRISESRNVNYG